MPGAFKQAEQRPFSDRRAHARQPSRSLDYVELDEGNGGIILDLSEGGLSVQAAMGLMDDLLPRVRFQLSPSKDWIQTSARVAWKSDSKKLAGLRFLDLPEQAQGQIQRWIAAETLRAKSPTGSETPAGSLPEKKAPEKAFEKPSAVANRERVQESLPPARAGRRTSAPGDVVIRPPTAEEQRRYYANSSENYLGIASSLRKKAQEEASPPSPATGRIPGAGRKIAAATIVRQKQEALAAPKLPSKKKAFPETALLAVLFGVLAIIALGGGWFAVRGTFHLPFRTLFSRNAPKADSPQVAPGRTDGPSPEVAQTTDQKSGPSDLNSNNNSEPEQSPAPPVASAIPDRPAAGARAFDIEIVDMNNQRWTIPFIASSSATAGADARQQASSDLPPQPRNRKATTIQSENLSASARRNGDAAIHDLPRKLAPVPPPANQGNALPAPVQSTDPANSRGAGTAVAPPEASPPGGASPEQGEPGLLQHGQIIRRVDAIYPKDALTQKVEGTVTLRLTVGADGSVRTVKTVSGPRGLVDSAETAVRQWRYSPAMLNGNPVEAQEDVTFTFRLP